ncbi:putative Serine hydroxymethyltransferase [Leishmania utingensis]|uniref:Serine hydroxymethyltransferase n=1 Tax=Leishmania utingensis TaxID=653362 RepID=A0AAW3ASN7_9TRYP
MASLLPTLAEQDPELANMIELEMSRQFRGLEMIASENLTSKAVLECLGSALTNKYAEGEPGNRYYGGTVYVDMVENLAKKRALAAFGLDPEVWGVNVQPYSGSPANFAAYTALLEPHSRIMGLDLPSGGHLTHGFYTPKKKVSATSIYFESFPYRVKEDGLIDYDTLESVALVFRPQMIIAGASAYARDFDYERFRHICDEVGSLLLMDMAHTAGLIAGGALKSPFPYADVVTTTTHKSLRGPRAGMIFYRKKNFQGNPTDYENRINQAVFPGCQGGPHEHQIAAIATQMREVCTPEWKVYAKQVQSNAHTLADALSAKGHKFVSGGTDNHLLLWNVRVHGLTGSKMEKLLDAVSISVNKNTIPGDKSAMTPGGIRVGTLSLTSRGMVEADMRVIAEFLDRAIELAKQIQTEVGSVKLNDFVEALPKYSGVAALRRDVEAFATTFAIPTFDVARIKYRGGPPEEL